MADASNWQADASNWHFPLILISHGSESVARLWTWKIQAVVLYGKLCQGIFFTRQFIWFGLEEISDIGFFANIIREWSLTC